MELCSSSFPVMFLDPMTVFWPQLGHHSSELSDSNFWVNYTYRRTSFLENRSIQIPTPLDSEMHSMGSYVQTVSGSI